MSDRKVPFHRDLAAFGSRISVRTNDGDLDAHWAAVFADLLTPESSDSSLTVMRNPSGHYSICLNEEEIVRRCSEADVLALSLSAVNEYIIKNARHAVIHAAGAAINNRGVLMPASMEAGKTTTVAGLIRRGWGYLSDEAVGIDDDAKVLCAYHKPLSIDSGSWDVLSSFAGGLTESAFQQLQWQIPVGLARPDAMVDTAPAAFIVVPDYSPQGQNRLERARRPWLLAHVAGNVFQTRYPSKSVLGQLGVLVRRVRGYRLTIANLDAALDLLEELVAQGDG